MSKINPLHSGTKAVNSDTRTTLSNNDVIHKELTILRKRLDRSEHKLRITYALAFIGVCVTVTMTGYKNVYAQGYTVTLAQLATRMVGLETKNRNLETKTASMSTLTEGNGYSTVRFSAVNVQVISGAGQTDATTNGTGNLIVGYNLNKYYTVDVSTRTGSHNLIIGSFHLYHSYGGLIGGGE